MSKLPDNIIIKAGDSPIVLTPYRLSVAASTVPNSGDGVFAAENIPAGAYICEYTGKLTNTSTLTQTETATALDVGHGLSIVGNNIGAKINDNIVFGRPFTDAETADLVLNETYPTHDNAVTNCSFAVTSEGLFARGYVVTIAPIPAGSELFVRYGSNYWLHCLCDAGLVNTVEVDRCKRILRERIIELASHDKKG